MLISLLSVIICFHINVHAGIVCAIGFAGVSCSCFVFTIRRYKKIAALSDYISKMSDGDFFFDIRDNQEGELSILKNDIYKLTTRLSEQATLLKDEKMLLKDVLFNISHQLKTPLTSLSIMADLLEQENLPPEKRAEFTNNLQNGLSRMEWLVLSLLKMAKLDANTIEMKPEKALVHELIVKAVDPLKIILDIHNQNITIVGDPRLEIFCDINWTAEALTNIMKNAAEHSEHGGEITINFGENPICTWISVSDNGTGIDKKDLPHLFNRFYKGNHSRKDSVGIGLAMSMSIVQKQKGDIEVETNPSGSTFTVKFYIV